MSLEKILLIIILLLIIVFYIKYGNKDVVYMESDIDNNVYLVRDMKNKLVAANLLAKIKRNIDILVSALMSKKDKEYKEYEPYISQLNERIKGCIISENGGDSIYTSYSVNKGEQIIFCLRSKKNDNELHDLNLMMYVVLHELAHVACPEYDHTPLFKKIFAFITKVAIELDLYKKIDFSKNPMEYCGMTITDSII